MIVVCTEVCPSGVKHFLSLHALPYDSVSRLPVVLVGCGCTPCSLTHLSCSPQMISHLAKAIRAKSLNFYFHFPSQDHTVADKS